ncbi:MAG: AMP-binding protein [Angelakisella sp.]
MLKPLFQTIGDCLHSRAVETPELPAVAYQDESYTWRELDEISDVLALRCLEMGVKKGTNAGIWGVNSFSWLAYFFALVKIGAVPVLINICYREQELADILSYADVEYLFRGIRCKDTDYAEVIEHLDRSKTPMLRKIIAMESPEEKVWLHSPKSCKPDGAGAELLRAAAAQLSPEEVACILFTSGTSALPKGVLLTHKSLLRNARQHSVGMGWTEKDRMCLSVPLFHCFGITVGILTALYCGASLQLVKYYSTSEVLNTIETYRCTILSGVPSMFLALIGSSKFSAHDISSLRSGVVAGSPLPPEDYMRVCEQLKSIVLQPAYGQTESSPCITMATLDDSMEDKATTAGRAIPGVELTIWDTQTNCILPVGKRGEIRARGYNVMKGYYKLPEATAQVLTPDGWLKTGDEGYLDERGYLHVTGRLKDIIIRGGENISPMEVEACIRGLPEVESVKVIGLPTSIMQEEVVACVICHKGMSLLPQQVIARVKGRMSAYKVPQHVLFFERFPMTPSGKISQKELKNQATELLSEQLLIKA